MDASRMREKMNRQTSSLDRIVDGVQRKQRLSNPVQTQDIAFTFSVNGVDVNVPRYVFQNLGGSLRYLDCYSSSSYTKGSGVDKKHRLRSVVKDVISTNIERLSDEFEVRGQYKGKGPYSASLNLDGFRVAISLQDTLLKYVSVTPTG